MLNNAFTVETGEELAFSHAYPIMKCWYGQCYIMLFILIYILYMHMLLVITPHIKKRYFTRNGSQKKLPDLDSSNKKNYLDKWWILRAMFARLKMLYIVDVPSILIISPLPPHSPAAQTLPGPTMGAPQCRGECVQCVALRRRK